MKKNKISKNWINKQRRDIYVKQSKIEGYRSRAVYKLQEIDEKFKTQIKKYFNSKIDVVVSDMAVNTTGNKNLDSIVTGELCLEAMKFAVDTLNQNGKFVSKIFMGSSFNEIVADSKKLFKETKVYKPLSSRKDSKENFIICKFLR